MFTMQLDKKTIKQGSMVDIIGQETVDVLLRHIKLKSEFILEKLAMNATKWNRTNLHKEAII